VRCPTFLVLAEGFLAPVNSFYSELTSLISCDGHCAIGDPLGLLGGCLSIQNRVESRAYQHERVVIDRFQLLVWTGKGLSI